MTPPQAWQFGQPIRAQELNGIHLAQPYREQRRLSFRADFAQLNSITEYGPLISDGAEVRVL